MNNQREFFFYDKRYKAVRGYFYIGDRRVRHKLCGFREAGLDDDGQPIDSSAKANKKRSALFTRLHAEVERTLLKGERDRKAKGKSLKNLLQEWLDYAAVTRAKGTVDYYLQTANTFTGLNGEFPITDFSLRHADKLITHLHGRGLSTASVNIRLKSLKAFLRWCHERGEISEIPKIKILRDDEKLPVTLSDAQVRALMERISRLKREAPNPYHRRCYLGHERFVLVLGLTGCRRGEAFYLPWKQIDLDTAKITVRKQTNFRIKEGVDKVLVMPPVLAAYLREQREEYPEDRFLLDNGHGGLIYASPYGITVAIRRHLEALGFREHGLKPLHGFRAKWISDLYRHGFDLQTIARGAGHRRIETTAGYLSDPDVKLREAAAVIGENWRGIGEEKSKILQVTDN